MGVLESDLKCGSGESGSAFLLFLDGFIITLFLHILHISQESSELNSKTLGCESIGEIKQGESEYNSSAANKALQDAYTAIVRTSYFNGLLYARREDSINPTYWRIEGLKSSNNYGYIKITSYSNNMEEHKYVLMDGNWSWIS